MFSEKKVTFKTFASNRKTSVFLRGCTRRMFRNRSGIRTPASLFLIALPGHPHIAMQSLQLISKVKTNRISQNMTVLKIVILRTSAYAWSILFSNCSKVVMGWFASFCSCSCLARCSLAIWNILSTRCTCRKLTPVVAWLVTGRIAANKHTFLRDILPGFVGNNVVST